MRTFREFVNEGLFSKKKIKLDDKVKSILRTVTDIVGSWRIDGDYLIGDGTDMEGTAKADLKRVQKQFPDLDFELFEISKKYFGIRTKINSNTIDYITKIGYK